LVFIFLIAYLNGESVGLLLTHVSETLLNLSTCSYVNFIFYSTKINGNDIDPRKRLYVLDELDCIINRLKDRRLKELEKDKITVIPDEDPHQNQQSNQLYGYQHKISNNQNYNKNNLQSNYPNNLNRNGQVQNDDDFEGVTLDTLLTIMDGCVVLNGPIFMATTNYIDLIDKSLTRPGRFDICLNLGNSKADIIEQIINHFAKKHKSSKKIKNKKNKKHSSSISTVKSSKSYDEYSYCNKMTDEQRSIIYQCSEFNGCPVWSPAKISQICLFYIDEINYYDKVLEHLKNNYDNECKLLN
jgi:SpoVK/Ycf46/Vps4 family AAA+-type ATPase